jgi:hypothetical protein
VLQEVKRIALFRGGTFPARSSFAALLHFHGVYLRFYGRKQKKKKKKKKELGADGSNRPLSIRSKLIFSSRFIASRSTSRFTESLVPGN